MRWRWVLATLLVAAVAGKKKHRHHKPGRALLDRLASTPVGEVIPTSAAEAGAGELLPAPLDVAPYSLVEANATCGQEGAEDYCRDTPGKRARRTIVETRRASKLQSQAERADVALYSLVEANATCGQEGAEDYCRDTPGKRVVVCDVCEGLEGSLSRRHPPLHAIDGDSSTWWQSPTLAAGDFQNIELIATLPDKMELLHVIIKSGPSPRPLAWSLEVSASENGDDWRLVRAFGDREHCKRIWDLRPERRRRKARAAKRSNRDKPTCSTQFASPRPLENGEMHVGIGEGVSARRVRVSFRASHPAPALHQFYTVRALTLAARCLCHGHAQECHVTSEGARCSCFHNTCGSHCQRCCSGGVWKPNEPCSVETDQCSCGERGACTYDDTGAILCVNCTENRAGPLCDRCLIGFYNDVPDGPCLPCNCDSDGSDGSCVWDKKHRQVSCNCRPGYSGALCDACEEPLASFPSCQIEPTTEMTVPACKCDPRGIMDPTRVCDDVCECKANVVGERCDACAPGHFGLSESLAEGCRRCYCSHISDSCSTADPESSDEIPASMVLPLTEGWKVTDADLNETYDPSLDDDGKLYLVSYEVEGWESFYWYTNSLSGEQLTAYGSEIVANMFWGIVRGDTGGNPTVGPDVILLAEDGTKLAHGNRSYDTPGQLELVVPIVEGDWYRMSDDVTRVGRVELMDVLRDLKAMMVRAHFHGDQDEVRLESIELRAGSDPTEQCLCPVGYSGNHCERCTWTHTRVKQEGVTPSFQCVSCDCNRHAGCDYVNGPCGPCQHNTTGPHCERCLPGHYGNPVQGSCFPCACPLYLPSNNFSPNCALASAEGDEFVCTQCPDGYTGDHCEHCDYGYWGSPTTPGSSCQPCDCGGAPCDSNTGLCITCPPHTEGARCDQCQEGYWFGPAGYTGTGASCIACECGRGALSTACDPRNGQCACKEGWGGDKCDKCGIGHGGLEAGCPPCRCGLASLDTTCDAVFGACVCAPGAAPPSCTNCLDDYFGLDVSGCKGCNCSSLGAESNACDIRTGQCRCRPHVTGRACDTCKEGYWGLQQGGCRRCSCGAGAAACDPVSGACACAPGVGGAHCDTCMPGFYGFGPAGCLPCPVCTDGKVCSPDTGRCVCPARSHGPGCKQCAAGYTARSGSCMPCSCGPGAVSNQCDPMTGQCRCRTGWSGIDCTMCAPGHFGPRCRPCDCSVAGTRECGNETCPCDDLGRCPCKENVVGDKCDQCLEGTFGLSADNPTGCTACFCFGRTAHCSQASVTRAALHAATPVHLTLLLGDSVTSMDQESLLAIHTHSPDVTISLPWPPVPVYMELDKRFLGDRVTSYGGTLRFRVEEEGGQELPADTRARFPLVRLYGRHIVLDYYERVPPINGTHMVRLHESLWTVRTRRPGGAIASRSALMLALQQLDRIMLRVTTRAPTYDDHVHALLLNVSLDTAIPGLSRSEPALGVEMCDCPRGYSAGSCQQPAVGFWIPPQKVHISNVAGTIVINLEGDAQPCHCNGRAAACDAVTGDCLNCTGGTGGPRCAVCAEGYHGTPESPGGCQACPCPSRARNFASACVMNGNWLQCLCKPGYTGRECESCAVGFVRSTDGSCVPCACDPVGSVVPQCDNRGRCRCRSFATGMKCDQCVARRTYMDEDGCQTCDNCTQTLIDSIEHLTYDFKQRLDLNELNRIPSPFPALLEYTHNATILRNELHILKKRLEHSRKVNPLIEELQENEHRVFTNANAFKEEASRRAFEAYYLSLESMRNLEEILKQKSIIGEQVGVLDDFARGERHLSAHRALKEAKHLLRHIKDIKLIDYIEGVNDVFDSANLQSTSVQEYNYRLEDANRRINNIRTRLDEWQDKMEDLTRLGDKVWSAGDIVAALAVRVRPRLSAIRDIALRCRLVLEDINGLSPQNLTEEIHTNILRAHNLGRGFPALIAELQALSLAAEEKEGILYNLTPTYRQKYLTAVEKHVEELGKKAKEYKSLFAGTRAVASAGVTAARAWSDVAETVRNASDAANIAASTAHTAMKMARGPIPMTNMAQVTKAASEDLKRRGAAVLARAEGREHARLYLVTNIAHTAMKMARGPIPMTNTAQVTKAASEDLKRRGAAVLARAEGREHTRLYLVINIAASTAHTAMKMARGPIPMTNMDQVTKAASEDLKRRGAAVLARAEGREHTRLYLVINIAASTAHTAMKMAMGPIPMTNMAQVTKAASEDLKRRGAAVLARAEELRTQLEHLRRGADLVSVILRGLGWQERDLGLRPTANVASTLATTNEQADRVLATTRVLYDEASEYRRRVRYNLRRQLAELQRHGDTALGAAQEHVSQIRGNTVRAAEVAEALAAAAAARAREHDVAKTTLSPAMMALRDKIARAKHAADSISVSLTSSPGAGVGCSRSYPLRSSSSAVTRVAIAVTFDNTVRDGPLMYLLDNSQETENYMKLSVENKRLKLIWDLGSGEGVIQHPEELQPAHDDGDHTSYRLDIERIWNTVHLTVKKASGTPITATNSTLPSAVNLHASQLWLGYPGDVTGLPGCVHALYNDDKTIGLWNFDRQPKEAQCTGCTQRWYNNARGGETLVWFNGAGYAELRRSNLRPSDRRQFSLAFTFKTRDEDALLFMAMDANNNRSVSVLMRSCRVVFRVEYAASLLEITAAGRHCHGRPARVQAIRVFANNKLERGSLRVNGEETLGSPFPPVQSGASLPDLTDSYYWLGGTPPGGRAPAPPLLGCMGAVTVDREGYDLLDVPTRHGVEARCDGFGRTRALRSATLEGSGYIELSSPHFRRKAALGLSFRARGSDGLLLFRTPSIKQDNEVDDEDDGDDRHYLVLVMSEGELELIAAAGKTETRLRTNGTRFDDGRLHTVRIIRAHKQLELWVDEERVAVGTLAGNAYPARASGTFIGGVDHWDSTRMPEIATDGFTGTIADFIVDSSLIGFETAVNWSGARLGRADSELRLEPRTEPRALQAQPDSSAGCTKAPSYTVEAGAVKFGDSPASHAVLKLPPKTKELALSLQFRTFASDGILLFSPGTKSKPKHYLALIVKEGKLNLVVRGRKRRQIALGAFFVSDGTWRSVSIRVSRQRMILASAGAASTAHAPAAARAPRLYIGGYPAQPSNPHLPNAILRLGGFRGCVRKVTVNGRTEDLVRDAHAHYQVGQCFPMIEQGAYFAGDSYAAWAEQIAADNSLELRAMFRSSEPQGVLLATKDFVLELRDGTLVLIRQSSTGQETSRTESRGVGGRALCDNAWHTVVARISRASLSLSLDAGPELKGVATGTLLDDESDSPLVVSPLYVGGLPEGTVDSPDSIRENFKGCIRDVTAAGHKLNWTSMETLHNVLLDSCPIA